ncbi:hypothetical protein RCE20_27680, partial [Klebsiella pneumoniae]|nr:hypothetical protein [Klebsiella pneumoniae]MDX7192602.1 hypothetical protein [Klebsiella pneumoniae]
MAELNPPLGTTTPEIFLDNVKRADELVNGPAGTINDRGGEPLDTWRQMMAKNDEIRQNLIPLSKQYMTLEAAQADIANIPAGSTTYVRSQDGSSLADEYINLAGTLQPTGRRMVRDDYAYQVSPDSVTLAAYDPETSRVAPFLNTSGRLIQIGPDGKYYELLTQQESELYALGRESSVPQFIGGEQVWRMTVDSTTNQIVEAYTVGGKHWIYSDGGLVAVNNGNGGGG